MKNKLKTVTLDLRTAENIFLERTNIDLLTKEFIPPLSDEFTRSIVIDGHIYLLARGADLATQLITISLAQDDTLRELADQCRGDAIHRILKAGVILLSQSGAIPINWRPYHSGQFISIQSNSKASGETARIVLDTRPAEKDGHIFAGIRHKNKEKLEQLHPDYSGFNSAIRLLSKTTLADEQPRADVSSLTQGHRLSNPLLDFETAEITYEEWIERRLTKEQIAFVNQPLTSSIRLMGPPGSGKTIALSVKALKTLAQAHIDERPFRLLILTHAMATADLIEYLLMAMDQSGALISSLSESIHMDVTTIFALANRHMHYDLEGLKPLSLDGTEGRTLQFELLESLIKHFFNGEWIAYRSDCREGFVECMEECGKTQRGKFFVWELMNEFACVLDAEGGRPTGERRKRYLEEKRKSWMMQLNPGAEREVVLELYKNFRLQLQGMRTITGDQMIADYLNWLDMNKWEALRLTSGYDAIFVDELHLFNRQERMVFRKLLRDPDTAPVVVMAYDPKQSPRDTFAGLSGASDLTNFWTDAKLGRTEKIELVDIFRYTPQIARALALIDQSFPGQDLDDEWPKYAGVSRIDDGPIPTLTEFKSTPDLYRHVFPRAKELQRKIGAKKKVAILCASNDLFQKYADASEYKNDFILISSREDLPKTKDSMGKFIYSAPEYVAGLQFDTVLLIEANDDEVPDGAFRASVERKFVSILYLGASRAEHCLEIYATKEHEGPSKLLNLALKEGAIKIG